MPEFDPQTFNCSQQGLCRRKGFCATEQAFINESLGFTEPDTMTVEELERILRGMVVKTPQILCDNPVINGLYDDRLAYVKNLSSVIEEKKADNSLRDLLDDLDISLNK